MISTTSITLLSALAICGATAVDTGTEVSRNEVEVNPPANVTLRDLRNRTNNCPWRWFPYGTRCFKFVPTTRTWAESERYCVMMGGNLASVHSADQYYFIQELVRRQTQATPITWIGGYDATQEGLWLWSDGSRFDYSHWSVGQPDNARGVEHCLDFNFGGSLRWNDRPCSTVLPSVCSMDARL